MVSSRRIAGYWLLVIAAWGLLGTAALGQPQGEQKAQAPAAQRAEVPTAPPPNLDADKPKPYKPTCSAPKDQSEAEVCETVRANDIAAKNLFWVRLGTGAVILSLIFTGWAALAAAEAAKAARASVQHAEADAKEQSDRFERQIGVAVEGGKAAKDGAEASLRMAATAEASMRLTRTQLRAYIEVGNITVEGIAAHSRPMFRGLIKNLGNTRATHVAITYHTTIGPFPPVQPLVDERPVEGAESMTIMGVGVSVPLEQPAPRVLAQADIDGLVAGRLALWLHGRVTYRDVFGDEQYTCFRLMVGGDRGFPDNGAVSVCEAGNEGS